MREYYTEEQILAEFNKLTPAKQNKILKKALDLALSNSAGTYGYAIAYSMGYGYQDDGTYEK